MSRPCVPRPGAMLQGRIREVITLVASTYGFTADQIMIPTRERYVTQARRVAMWLLRERLHLTVGEIGRQMGYYDHSPVVCSLQRVRDGMRTQGEFAAMIEALESRVEEEREVGRSEFVVPVRFSAAPEASA